MYKYEYAYTIQTEFRLLPEYANRSVFSPLFFVDIFCTYSLWLPHSPHCKHQIGCFSSYSLVSKRNTEKPNAKAVMQNIPCEMQLFYIFQLFIFVYILVHFAWLIFRKLQMEKVFELRNNCTAKAF